MFVEDSTHERIITSNFASEIMFRKIYKYMIQKKYKDDLFRSLYLTSIPDYYNVAPGVSNKKYIGTTTESDISRICGGPDGFAPGEDFEMLKNLNIIDQKETCKGFNGNTMQPDLAKYKYNDFEVLIKDLCREDKFSSMGDKYVIKVKDRWFFKKANSSIKLSEYLVLHMNYVVGDIDVPIVYMGMVLTNVIDKAYNCYSIIWKNKHVGDDKIMAHMYVLNDWKELPESCYAVLNKSLYLFYTKKNNIIDASIKISDLI